MRIERHFWRSKDFQIHYREHGKGETVLLIHEMPLSSQVFVPLMQEIGDQLHLIAVDLPGYGDSDSVNDKLTIPDYAKVLIEMLDSLQINRFSIFGVHGGASVAIDLAAQAPNRVEKLILSGVPIFTEEERKQLHNNLAPFQFQHSGEHFLFWWESFTKKWDESTPKKIIHNAVLDIIKAGPNYEWGYREAFDYDPLPALKKLEQPILLPVSQGDPLVLKNKVVMDLKPTAKELIIEVPQHIAQLATEKTATCLVDFIKN